MTYNNNGKEIPYGLYYLTSDDCLVCGTIRCIERCRSHISAGACPGCESQERIERYFYYLSAGACPASESKESIERYYKEIEDFSKMKLGDIHYVNLSHEENPTDVNLNTFPIFVEYNEIGRFIRVGNRVHCNGYPLINRDVGWEKWRFDEDTRKKWLKTEEQEQKNLS